MRVALISDLHGNLVALRAALERIEAIGVDQVACLGDVATLGPAPAAVIAVLAELGCPCIMGNHDAFMLQPDLVHEYTKEPAVLAAVDACRASLGAAEMAFIQGFRATLDLDLDAAMRLLLFHGSPRSHTEDLLATTSPDELDHALEGSSAAVLAGGHTHIQMLRQHRGRLLVNPGSVGLPFETFVAGGPPRVMPHAEFAVIETSRGHLSVVLHRVPLDRGALLEALDGWDNPLRGYLHAQYAS
jgi:predicted phosphodiesterase